MNAGKLMFGGFLFPLFFTVAAMCGYSQARYHTGILPSVPYAEPSASLDPPPTIPSSFSAEDVPVFLLSNAVLAQRKTLDAIAERAQREFEAGRRAYQANDIPGARQAFDSAIDLMLEAPTLDSVDAVAFEQKLEALVDAIHKYDLEGLGSSAVLEDDRYERAPLEDILQMTFPVDPKLKDRVRDEVTATESQLPLSVNDAVLGYINFFANRGRRTLVAGMERAGRYKEMIDRILDEEGVPRELIHLAQAESGFMPRVMSRAAAGGMWQFLKWRGQEYGLAQTAYTDERMDPEKATRAAAHHLRDLYNEFGDWYLAIAAYNCGPNVVERAVERTGYADFWELRSRGVLPAETTNYVPIILAMTIMEKNAAEYGLDSLQPDPTLAYDTVQLSAPASLDLVSDITETPAAEIAALNPSLLHNVTPEGFSLHVPKGGGAELAAAIERVPAEHRISWRLHKVQTGETLAAIGKRFGMTTEGLVSANHFAAAEAAEGDWVVIPAAARPQPAAHRTYVAARRGTVRPAPHATSHPASHPATVAKPAAKKPVIVAHASAR
ncbi:MAG: transglycosylase SLT domain-containing protein [Bryobacteraceae bacterium]|jgi:membrane-bound lytic murein transglycosylase D